ncbi:TetR/AcrR family transcriptional regulator [Paenibacillus filicis]|uniref:TetR/AcrR family transcriptional regulator n=1 Tax=Paenibacillus gyeongsangnamensis TaxID=3388067 RepID=A0ABT4QJM5_9BACL|nr:TetR/AcrR family transcriptional regulator [Paenibacillus filicis]MCZ8517065.1 TetR/AcrR family transcriptional regulator [Paenibacillus filicis]
MARTKEFDEDAVLFKAMRLFWEQGYEKTSIQELVSHMGIHKGSMYDTFGDKQSLYVKALKRYSEMLEQSVKRRVADTRSAKEAIRLLFEMAIRQREESPDGCLVVNTAVELAKHDSESREWVLQDWARTEQLIRDIIVKGQQSGEFSKTLNAELLSYFFNNALIGLRVMVKTITDREKLRQIIEMNMSVLE